MGGWIINLRAQSKSMRDLAKLSGPYLTSHSHCRNVGNLQQSTIEEDDNHITSLVDEDCTHLNKIL